MTKLDSFLEERDDKNLSRLEGLVQTKLLEVETTQKIVLAETRTNERSKFLEFLDGEVGAYRILYDTIRSYRHDVD